MACQGVICAFISIRIIDRIETEIVRNLRIELKE
jgi:hypothetical protein